MTPCPSLSQRWLMMVSHPRFVICSSRFSIEHPDATCYSLVSEDELFDDDKSEATPFEGTAEDHG